MRYRDVLAELLLVRTLRRVIPSLGGTAVQKLRDLLAQNLILAFGGHCMLTPPFIAQMTKPMLEYVRPDFMVCVG